jgi:predicted nucleotidyltransferase
MVATDVEIADIVRSVVSELEPKVPVSKVILYGSYASNAPKRWSDIDIAIVSPGFSGLPIWRRQELLAESLPGADVRLSPLAYAPEELSRPTPFLREIIRTGRVVYEAPAE